MKIFIKWGYRGFAPLNFLKVVGFSGNTKPMLAILIDIPFWQYTRQYILLVLNKAYLLTDTQKKFIKKIALVLY